MKKRLPEMQRNIAGGLRAIARLSLRWYTKIDVSVASSQAKWGISMTYYMITIQPGTLMTAEEFTRLPREDGWHYELAEGRLVRMSLAGYNHDVVVSRLAARLLPFVEEHNLGECTLSQAGYLLSQRGEPDTVRSPDLRLSL